MLDSWTRGAAAELDDAAKLLFQFLCCLEEEDRLAWVAQSNWGDLWRRLERPGEPPALEPTLAVVVERGLVDVVDRVDTVATGEPTKASAEQQALRTRYRIHPGVAEAARRDVAPGFQEAVERELAAFWSVGIGQGVDRDDGAEVGPLVIRAGLGVVPYLLRLGDWSYARTCIEQVIGRDLSPGTLSGVLPYLRHIAEAARGTPHELKALGTLAKSLAPIDAEAAEATYRAVLERALAAQELWTASVVAGELVELLRKRGRLEDALEMVEREMEYTRRSGQGPWSQLMDECQRLKILTDMGRHEEALAEARRLRQVMAGLPEKSDDPEALKPWKVREAIAIVAQKAALSLKRWEEALAINAETIASREARGATRLQITHALFSNYSALLRLKRYDECRLLLKYCRDVFEAEHDMAGLAAAFTALADLEDESGHHAEAAAFEERSLRYEYALGHPASIAVSHSNLALYSLRSGADSPRSVLHLLATAVIRLHFEDGQLASTIRSLAGQLATNPPVPESFAALADQLEQTEGVRFRELMRRVIPDAAAGDAALVEVLRRARSLPAEETLDLQPYLDKWQPMVAAVSAAALGDTAALEAAQPLLDQLAATNDWAALVSVLRRIVNGERGAELLDGLDRIDTAIAARVLDIIAHPETATAATGITAQQLPEISEPLQHLIAAVVAAVGGDAQALQSVQTLLDAMTQRADWMKLAAVVRRILAGERDPSLAHGLDPTDTAVVTRLLDRLGEHAAPHEPGEPEIMDTVRDSIESCLRRYGVPYEVRPDRNLVIRQGSAGISIRVLMWNDRCFIHYLAPVAVGIANVTPELTRYLAETNNRLLLGKFSLDTDKRTVWFEHALLGTTADDEALMLTLTAVALIADEHDERVAALSGGLRYADA